MKPRSQRSRRAETKAAESDPALAHQPAGHGRRAQVPTQVPRRGWFDILWRVKEQIKEDNLSIVAAGVAFYGFVAVVPALGATIALYALFADPAQMVRHFESLSQVVPGQVMPLLREQIARIASDDSAAGISALVGLAIALYSSAKATKALIVGLNIAYDETERRGFFRLNFTALAITLGSITAWIAVISLVAVAPAVLNFVGLSSRSELVINILRWPLVAALFMGGLASIYRLAPSREAAQWRWLSWGAGVASLLWILGSVAFSFYVSNFGNYDKTYGSLGAIVVFLLWLFLSAYVVLLGAEINAEMERQTAQDTTKGESQPLGERGAYAADTIGPAKPGPGARKQRREAPQKQDISS